MHQNPHYTGPRRRREKGPEKTFEEIIAKHRKENSQPSPEEQRVPGRINPKRNTPRHRNQTDKNERQR